jgi:DNA polymerase-1
VLTLLIDSHGLGYRVHHSLGALDGGIAFGFLSTILRLAERYSTNQFLFCWEGGGSLRKEESPEYKASRVDKTPEEQAMRKAIHEQFNALRDDVLPSLGFSNHFAQHGYEADDLIASLVMQNPHKPFIVVSSDNDLFQLLQFSNCKAQHLLSTDRALTASQFMVEHRVPARRWPLVKAMAGCHGDGVKGVPGVAEKTAVKYIIGELGPNSRKSQELAQSQALIYFNYKLVRLPFPGVAPMKTRKDTFDENDMLQTFSDLGFDSFISPKQSTRWRQFCRGEFARI